MADNKINVGGRLHSIATGNILAGADEILDDSKGKKQSEINADTDNALADRYTKDETYNKTELNSLITTPNVQYTSVTATEQTTVVTDILPSVGAANTIYRVGKWNGTQYNNTVYSEYAWDGSAYVQLDVKEYGIDDEPTAESDNLVKSGGVYEKISQLAGKVEGETIINSISANGSKKLLTTALPAGAIITSVTGLDSASTRAIILYEDSQDETGWRILVNSDLPAKLAKAYTYWQAYQPGSPTCVMTVSVPSIEDLQSDVRELSQDVKSNNLNWLVNTNKIIFEKGSFEPSGANVGSGTRIRCTEAISTGFSISVPDGYLIHEVYYYSRWISNSDFTLAIPYRTVAARTYYFENTYPLVRFSIRKTNNNETIDVDEFLDSLYILTPHEISDVLGNSSKIAASQKLVKEQKENIESIIFTNLNISENFHIGEELGLNGNYYTRDGYTSSGDMNVYSSLQYKTNYTGKIYCYGINGYIDRVSSGSSLPLGTIFVRINWLSTEQAPYFYAVSDKTLEERVINVENKTSFIIEEYKINENDIEGYELASNGMTYENNNWRTSQFVRLEDGKNYICNISGNYYYYNEAQVFLGRVNTVAGSTFNQNSYTGAVFMRTNAQIDTEIIINQVDVNGNIIPIYRVFDGYAKGIIGESIPIINTNKNIDSNINIELPKISSNIEILFKTKTSLYKQQSNSIMFSAGNILSIVAVPRSVSDSVYCDKSEVDISVSCCGKTQTIPLRLNNYGKDLFSLRLKYPVVTVALDGLTTITTPMPSAYEGMYIKKSDTEFSICYADDSVFKTFTLANYNDVNAFVDALKADTDITDTFEVIKYGCEGVSFASINNFSKILLCKEHSEILYKQGNDQPTYTGNVYWDSYPTFIRSSDIDYTHKLRINYQIKDGKYIYFYVSLDGMFLRFNSLDTPTSVGFLLANMNFIDSVKNVSILPFKRIETPMLSMQHKIVEQDYTTGTHMITSTMRQYEMLAYLKEKGFVGQNIDEAISSILGSNSGNSPTYCLTYDDYQKNIWTNENIRRIFNQFRAKPTLVYLFNATKLDDVNPPAGALTAEEYKGLKSSGWGIAAHGFCMYTDRLSYAQFLQGFIKNKEAWLRWYGEDIQTYNPHGAEITDYQFYLLKHIGYSSIISGSAYLGWFCESGTTIDVQFKRVTWMDSEQAWDSVKENIDSWAD